MDKQDAQLKALQEVAKDFIRWFEGFNFDEPALGKLYARFKEAVN
jgi:hypothetical protein